MFLEPEARAGQGKPPEKVLVRARPEEKERLARRAKELFPKSEIVTEAGEQFLCASLPLTGELFKLMEKFSVSGGKLSEDLKRQSYLIHGQGDSFCVVASAGAGLFFGMQGLREYFGKNGSAIDFFDAPRFGSRGFMQDLSRGQVLSLAGFERLVRALANCRYNWLTFNLEHNFAYARHPEISEGDDQFTIVEAKALSEFCREFYIEVVPMQQSLGHCRGILTNPKYRHLAFDDKLLWSLDPRKEEIYSLLSDLYQEQSECFPSQYFLVGCDEPFDLKKNWKPGTDHKTFPQVYMDHLLRLHKIVSGLGRKMMVWGDIFVSHPELLVQVPEDVVIINWQYGTSKLEGEEYYAEKSKAIAGSGRPFFAATTTWSYARLFPELKTMEHNNRNFLNVAGRLGAQGALLTNWGDLGHIQLLGHVAMPIAYFSLLSWRETHATLEEFSRDFSASFFGDAKGGSGEFYLLLERVNDIITPGKIFGASSLFILLDELFSPQFLPSRPIEDVSGDLLKVLKEAASVTSSLTNIKNYEWVLDIKPIVYAMGILFTKLLLKENASLGVQDKSKKEEILSLFGHLINYAASFREALKERWLAQAKPIGLERALARLAKVEEEYKKRMAQAASAEGRTWEQLRDAPEFSEYKFNLMKEMGLEGLL